MFKMQFSVLLERSQMR